MSWCDPLSEALVNDDRVEVVGDVLDRSTLCGDVYEHSFGGQLFKC